MGIRIDQPLTRIECETCDASDTLPTTVLMDATADARARGWWEYKTGYWVCPACMKAARILSRQLS
jgi:hypothetical protein